MFISTKKMYVYMAISLLICISLSQTSCTNKPSLIPVIQGNEQASLIPEETAILLSAITSLYADSLTTPSNRSIPEILFLQIGNKNPAPDLLTQMASRHPNMRIQPVSTARWQEERLVDFQTLRVGELVVIEAIERTEPSLAKVRISVGTTPKIRAGYQFLFRQVSTDWQIMAMYHIGGGRR